MKSCLPVVLLLFHLTLALAEDKDNQGKTIAPVIDQDPAMLVPPDDLKDNPAFAVAKEPPKITFSTLNGLPRRDSKTGGLWCSWGEGIVASNGKLYVGVGDHRGIDANCFLYEYDPPTHKHRQVLDMARLVGQKPGDYGHGKLHGRLDETPDGWIYMATYWGEHPDMPPAERSKIGGRLARYNVRTDTAEDLGMPLPGDSFPMHATDAARGVFHGLGLLGGYVAYDLHARRPLYAGPLPGDVTWELRSTLIDPKTGYCYGSETHTRRIVGYDPGRNVFFHTKATIPLHPETGKELKPWIRSYTRQRLLDGSFICQTYDGVMFKFFPDEERTELIGLNWVEGRYSTSMALSPDGRYLYYAVGAHGQTWQVGSPIIQMDTQTYARKVLAFLHPYYQQKYGYVFGGSYSVSLDQKAERLLIFWNGRFRSPEEKDDSFGHPTFMCLEIPAEERRIATSPAKAQPRQ